MIARRSAQSLYRQALRSAAVCRSDYVATFQQQRWKSTMPLDGKGNMLHSESDDNVSSRPAGSPKKLPIPDFSDARQAYASKTTGELVRAMVVFSLCRVPIIVSNSETLLSASRKILGGTLLDALLKATLFGHFCAGEDEKGIQPVLLKMQESGIGSILDYAHEDDGESGGDKSDGPRLMVPDAVFQEANNKVRVYDYESEQQCDKHVETFKKCINAVKNLDADGYAAIKVTALGPPKLLEKMSRALREVQILFGKVRATARF